MKPNRRLNLRQDSNGGLETIKTGRSRVAHALGVALLLSLVSPPCAVHGQQSDDQARLAQFLQSLEALRQQYRIPGLSAVIVNNGQIIWEAGFGFQDVGNQIPATPDTPYRTASITKTFASMLLMRCVEQGTLNLDTSIRNYTSGISDSRVTVRHLFTHTSQGSPPGQIFIYSGDRYNFLTPVVESCHGQSFREALAKKILDRVEMWDSVPGQDMEFPTPEAAALFTPDTLQRYKQVIQRLAKPYLIGANGQPVLSSYPNRNIFAAAGLISTVRDLARYDAAIDRHILLQAQTQEQAWTNYVNSNGQQLPHALGWFVQNHGVGRLVWHYGFWDTFSALFLKVPGRNITLILLANSSGLSAPFGQALGGSGNVTGSPFANLFLAMLSDPNAFPPPRPASIVSAASFERDAIAPDSIAVALGTGLATDTLHAPSPSLPMALAGTSVRVNGVLAPLFFVSPQQVNFLVPSSILPGTTVVDISAGDGTLSRANLTLLAVAPGIFTVNAQSSNSPVAEKTIDGLRYTPVSNSDGTLNPLNSGDHLILYGTGFRYAGAVAVAIGGINAQVSYAGPQGGLSGLDQLHTRIPNGLSGVVDVAVTVDGQTANIVKIRVQ